MTTSSVSQLPVIIATEATAPAAKVSMAGLMVLTKISTEAQVSQLVLMALSRRIGKRVFTQIDTGN